MYYLFEPAEGYLIRVHDILLRTKLLHWFLDHQVNVGNKAIKQPGSPRPVSVRGRDAPVMFWCD